MKKTLRTRAKQGLCLLLAILMLVSTLAACAAPDDENETTATVAGTTGGISNDPSNTSNDPSDATSPETTAPDPTETSGETATEAATEYVPNIEKKNYNKDFNIVDIGLRKEWLLVDEADVRLGNAMDEAVYARNARIEDQLGVTCAIVDAGSWTEYSNTIQRTVTTGDDAYQLVLTHPYEGVTTLATQNCLMDFADLPAVNINAPYWNSNLMEMLKMDGQYLLGYGDLYLTETFCVVFNKTMLSKYTALESPYQLVENNQWTIDKLFEMASMVSADNGDGEWDENDTYGISGWGWTPLISMVTASDIKIVDQDKDTGDYYLAYEDYTDRMLSLIDKVYDMYHADYSFMWPSNFTVKLDFTKGTSLFQLYSTSGLSTIAASGLSFGVLPYPKFDTEQENYQHLNWNGLMCVPSTVGDKQMVSEVLELLNYYTAAVKTAYYEVQLGGQIADAPEDVAMMNIIWNTLVSDIGLVCCNAINSIVYMLPQMCENNNKDFASYMKKNKRSAQRKLNSVLN